MSSLERIYTVPLAKAIAVPRYRRAEKAITILREFVQRHMKPEAIIIDTTVNEAKMGQREIPQLPTHSVVTPCIMLLSHLSADNRVKSEWV